MNYSRLLHTIRLWTIPGAVKRAEYLRKKNVFYGIGENCSYMDRKVPLYAKLIKIGNNVHFASHVTLLTHDVVHMMINRMEGNVPKTNEKVGCISIGDNVFIGANVTILYDVKIGNNVVIGAGSIVTRDIPDNSIVGGVPAKVLGEFDAFLYKRILFSEREGKFCLPSGEFVSQEAQSKTWELFWKQRQ